MRRTWPHVKDHRKEMVLGGEKKWSDVGLYQRTEKRDGVSGLSHREAHIDAVLSMHRAMWLESDNSRSRSRDSAISSNFRVGIQTCWK